MSSFKFKKQTRTISKRNNKYLDYVKIEASTLKPFELERQKLRNLFESLLAVELHYCSTFTKKKYLLSE